MGFADFHLQIQWCCIELVTTFLFLVLAYNFCFVKNGTTEYSKKKKLLMSSSYFRGKNRVHTYLSCVPVMTPDTSRICTKKEMQVISETKWECEFICFKRKN